MSLPRNGTLEKSISMQSPVDPKDSESAHPRLHHTSSVSSGSPASASGVVVPPPYSVTGSAAIDPPLELRGSLDCWACSVLVTAQNLVIATFNLTLAALIFGLILLPSLIMITSGFLCHSTVRLSTSDYCSGFLDDKGCVALLVMGFLLLAPLLVLALAAYCRVARHLQLGLCFIPYSRAVYKNLPASRHRGLRCCGQQGAGESDGKGSVWV